MRNFKHFTSDDSLKLEAYIKAGKTPREFAALLHKHISSSYK